MKYFTLNTVYNAYKEISKCTKEKFWGILSILYSIDNTINPNICYSLNTKKLSNFLEETFTLKNRKSYDDSNNIYSVVFADNWCESLSSNFITEKPNIMSIIIWAYRSHAFNTEMTSGELLELFLNDFHISGEIVNTLFKLEMNSTTIEFDNKKIDDNSLFEKLGGNNTEPGKTIKLNNSFVVANAGELSRGPFFQPLYASLDTLKCVIIFPFDAHDYYSVFKADKKYTNDKNQGNTIQKIYFGTPGSGKSYAIREKYETDETKVIRTTFHPDTDYATFVGCYKPITENEDGAKKISYTFVPQAFTEAYVKAWNDMENRYYLIIEEINRGNCAQIFGDLFQLLDRKSNGYSDYPIKADTDLKDYLLNGKEKDGTDILKNKEGIKEGKLCLPPNLSIIASMNTSDQSLFPMDSAFKRRWAWEYVPIDYSNPESEKFTININGKSYKWHDFLRIINAKIKKVTSSEDKQMGNFFIKASIDEKEFKDKVMFYLWSEIGKDNYQTNDAIFHCYKQGTQDMVEFSFNELYESGSTQKLENFMKILGEEAASKGLPWNVTPDNKDNNAY